MTTFGYARISTVEQCLDGQVADLKKAGATKIYSESATGAHSNRKELQRLLSKLQSGDTIIITRLDRLARSVRDLLNLVETFTAKGVHFKSLADAWADTTTPHGKLLLTVVGSIAEFERSLILARTSEGKKRAIERGVKMGRKKKLSPYQQDELLARLRTGETQMALSRSYGISQSTISQMAAASGV